MGDYWNWGSYANDAYACPLKLPLAGSRLVNPEKFAGVGTIGYYWTSSVSSTASRRLVFSGGGTYSTDYDGRASALAIRCIKN
ncbi:MAG: hypothetical protein PHT25_04915 [Bacteroidales bacterium]|nr:hypothetical protein [Bacteroidales bacterium]